MARPPLSFIHWNVRKSNGTTFHLFDFHVRTAAVIHQHSEIPFFQITVYMMKIRLCLNLPTQAWPWWSWWLTWPSFAQRFYKELVSLRTLYFIFIKLFAHSWLILSRPWVTTTVNVGWSVCPNVLYLNLPAIL